MFLGVVVNPLILIGQTSLRPFKLHWVSSWICVSLKNINDVFFLVPGFAICNTDKGDGGITLDELHADICQDFIASVSDSDTADSDFEYFDSNADGVVSLKEFLDLADTLINM